MPLSAQMCMVADFAEVPVLFCAIGQITWLWNDIWGRILILQRLPKSKLKLEHASDADAVAALSLRLVQRRIGTGIPFGTAFAGMPPGDPT